MVPAGKGRDVAGRMTQAMTRLYPSFAGNPDYTAIVSDRHHARLKGMVEEVRAGGAEVIEVNPAAESFGNTRKLAPAIVLNADPDARLMQEEIFGPILPIVEYGDVGEAISYVNDRDRPLALYWFGKDAKARRRVLRETVAGGVTVNDCLMHIAQEDQPFGGVGASGMGAYHGEWGFRTFSKEKPIFVQSPLSAGGMLRPPYGPAFERVLRLFRLMT